MIGKIALPIALLLFSGALAHGQDVVGLEICTAERDMARRTGCLQANVEYLQKLIAKNNAAVQQKLAAEIAALKAALSALKGRLQKLQAAKSKPDAPAAKATATEKPEGK
jgi:phage host-nuclease inhibitor protein Gam